VAVAQACTHRLAQREQIRRVSHVSRPSAAAAPCRCSTSRRGRLRPRSRRRR
jgi:hypothetical protein